jgi:hypothetical protein
MCPGAQNATAVLVQHNIGSYFIDGKAGIRSLQVQMPIRVIGWPGNLAADIRTMDEHASYRIDPVVPCCRAVINDFSIWSASGPSLLAVPRGHHRAFLRA